MAERGMFEIAISVPLVIEYEAKAMEAQHREAGELTLEEALAVVDSLVAFGLRTDTYFTYRPSVRDPDDEMVLETAINAKATAIVTFNRRDFGDGPARFGIECWSPSQALENLR